MNNSTLAFIVEMPHLNKYEVVIAGVKHVVSMCDDVVGFMLSLGVSFNCYDKSIVSFKIINGELCDTYYMDFYRVS